MTDILKQLVISLTALVMALSAQVAGLPNNSNVAAVGQVLGASTVYDEIRQEALLANSETNHPLPLFASWSEGNHWYYQNSGQYIPTTDAAGITPDWIMQMISQGHHMLPWMRMPFPGQEINGPSNCLSCWNAYYQTAVSQVAAQNLPLNFTSTQWEQDLYFDAAYRNLPADQNPNVIGLDGTVHTVVDSWGRTYATLSPFGPTALWYEVGKKWGSSAMMKQLETLYPNPPLIIFLSNNEANKLRWGDVETDKRYMDLYGAGKDDNFKRQVVADGWITRYRELQRGIRDGLSNATWKANSKFFGYEAFGPGHFGRWGGWKDYSLYIPNRIDPNPLIWDGGSPSFYYADYAINSDYKTMSPAVEAMNWEFIQNEAHQINPNFWFEFSAWAGSDSVKQIYSALGQNWTPERYGGSVQFGMWLERPRVVRDFPYGIGSSLRSLDQPWMDPLIAAVDRVYSNSILQTFWRQGTLVSNTSRLHPYQVDIPAEYASVNRMFLLTTNLDPAQPWTLDTVLPVFSLARVIGTAPNRQWLVYANSPQQDRTNVQVTIPNYKIITVNTTQKGSFYLVDEASDSVTLQGDTAVQPPSASDTTTPSVPSGLFATAVSTSQINLTWTSSTDNVGVTGYKIFRGGVQIATSITNSYSNTGLTASTLYSYTVSTYDGAGNNSAQSISKSATTQSSTPIVGDFNRDGIVNSIDLSLMTTAWNTNNATYDLNRDTIVNSLDYVIMVQNWSL